MLIDALRVKINKALEKHSMAYLSKQTGISRTWLIMIRDGTIENPGTKRVEDAIEAFKGLGF